MEQTALREREAKCVQESPPGCTAGCPVHVDVRGMIAAVRKQDYGAGFALFHRMVPFPSIISRICDQPCRQSCQRNAVDEPIAIRALERVCLDHNKKPPAPIIVPPLKSTSVAIVGAGLSGLTAGVELGRKGYKVVVYESSPRRGGSIWDLPESVLPRTVIEDDFAVFSKLPVEFRYGITVGCEGCPSLSGLCQEYDAVYLAVGRQQLQAFSAELTFDDSGRLQIDSLTLAAGYPRLFVGGSIRRLEYSPIHSISDGKAAAVSIDRLLQQASLSANRDKEGPYTSNLYTNLEGISPAPLIPMANAAQGYSAEEAALEADRCIQCECRECVKACEFMNQYRSYPKRLVREVYNNASIVMGMRHANKMINSCSLCGLCGEICPYHLSMGEVFHEARDLMVKKGKMPPSAHDFALRDMSVSNSDDCVLLRHQPGHSASSTVFYPGCQLAGSAPHHVRNVYDFLCSKVSGGVGLWLGCCGAPADWAGRKDLFQQTLSRLEESWLEMGKPKVITACPTCYMQFSQHLPNIPVETVWTLLDQIGLPDNGQPIEKERKLAIHDSCTTRNEVGLHNSVRNILAQLGYECQELPLSRDRTVCCGYGGLMMFANREVAHKVVKRRIHESELDYIAYCSMCRDNFAGQGKRALHLLDLLFGTEPDHAAEGEGPGYSVRQENRARLKRSLLRDLWVEHVEEQAVKIKLVIPDKVSRIMEERRILEDDIRKVIDYAEQTGRKLQSRDTGHYLAYYQPVSVTYWVEYSLQDDGFVVHNAYSHRIEISG